MTPRGFDRPGVARTASGPDCGRLKITVRDRATNRLTPCRINVVGPDGDFYQPDANRLSPYSLTGQWPETRQRKSAGQGPDFVISGGSFIRREKPRSSFRAGRFESRSGKDSSTSRSSARSWSSAGRDRSLVARTGTHDADGGDGVLSGRPAPALPPHKRSGRSNDPRPARSRGYPVRLDPGLQRAARPVHRIDGDDGVAPASRPGSKLGAAAAARPGSPPGRNTVARRMGI